MSSSGCHSGGRLVFAPLPSPQNGCPLTACPSFYGTSLVPRPRHRKLTAGGGKHCSEGGHSPPSPPRTASRPGSDSYPTPEDFVNQAVLLGLCPGQVEI